MLNQLPYRNITIATFVDNSLFKHEAYGASLRAAKILNDHGVAVAFKSVSSTAVSHAWDILTNSYRTTRESRTSLNI